MQVTWNLEEKKSLLQLNLAELLLYPLKIGTNSYQYKFCSSEVQPSTGQSCIKALVVLLYRRLLIPGVSLEGQTILSPEPSNPEPFYCHI